jgi:triphosphatase
MAPDTPLGTNGAPRAGPVARAPTHVDWRMTIERELKFSLLDPPPAAEELESAFRGSPFALQAAGTRAHHDLYYDDPSGTLAAAGLALRRRRSGTREVATLKTLGTVSGAAHEREEVEWPVESDGAWPEPILARLARHLGDGAPDALRPRLEIDTVRAVFDVRQDGRRLATLCFDDVEARYPGSDRSALFREAEIEADGDTPLGTLEAVAERLERIVALSPSGVTKLQRAEAVLLLGADLD